MAELRSKVKANSEAAAGGKGKPLWADVPLETEEQEMEVSTVPTAVLRPALPLQEVETYLLAVETPVSTPPAKTAEQSLLPAPASNANDVSCLSARLTDLTSAVALMKGLGENVASLTAKLDAATKALEKAHTPSASSLVVGAAKEASAAAAATAAVAAQAAAAQEAALEYAAGYDRGVARRAAGSQAPDDRHQAIQKALDEHLEEVRALKQLLHEQHSERVVGFDELKTAL